MGQPMKLPRFCPIGAVMPALVCLAAAPGLAGAELSPLPAWARDVGSSPMPASARLFDAGAFGAKGDGVTLTTPALQQAIDACAAAGGGTVFLQPGTYLSGALFLKSYVHLRVDAGVTILGTNDESAYPIIPTRAASIEMLWPAALINVNGQHDVEVSGGGTIDGQGEFWWRKYWALRKVYEQRGIRWAADYDCQRVRLFVAFNSKNVTLSGLRLRRSGFWTVQVTYCDHVSVDGIRITDNAVIDGVKGPSTDGVDIDSSSRVLVEHCDIDNNDDDICLKAGRDFDGLRVNRPTEYVVIRDNLVRRGGGVIAFGSETSGGIRHVVAYRNTGIGTSEGLRFKSAHTRGGTVEDILIRDVTLRDVPFPFTFTLDWNPKYSYATIPKDMANVPEYWRTIATPVEPAERGYPHFRDIRIESVTVTGAKRIMTAAGMAGNPLGAVHWDNVTAQGESAGVISDAVGWSMRNVTFSTSDGLPVKISNCKDVDSPVVVRTP
jgi:polygalacturonase